VVKLPTPVPALVGVVVMLSKVSMKYLLIRQHTNKDT
jgi:hypothetical protein